MTLATALGVAAGFGASLLYSLGAALQALEGRRAPPEYGLHLTLLRRLAVWRVSVGGTVCVFGGWGSRRSR